MPDRANTSSPLAETVEAQKRKSHGERVPFRKASSARVRMRRAEWEKVESAAGLKIKPEGRKRIRWFSNIYSSVGPLYSDSQSVLAKTAEKEIRSWRAATERLLRALSPADTDLAELIPKFRNDRFPKLSVLTPVGQVAFAALFATASIESALTFLSDERRNGRIQHDLWAAWACLVTRELTSAGLKATSASSDWSANKTPPYITTMQALQSFLPQECQHYSTPGSMVKGADEANKKFGELTEQTLLQILSGWGSQILTNYPGPLLKADQKDMAAFDDFAEKNLDEARKRLNEP